MIDRCRRCGAEVDTRAPFCTACGATVEPGGTTAPPPPPPPPPAHDPGPAPPSTSRRFVVVGAVVLTAILLAGLAVVLAGGRDPDPSSLAGVVDTGPSDSGTPDNGTEPPATAPDGVAGTDAPAGPTGDTSPQPEPITSPITAVSPTATEGPITTEGKVLPTVAPTTTAAPPACELALEVVVPGATTQATLYRATIPVSLVGSEIRLVVDGGPVVDRQVATDTTVLLAWQPGATTPSTTAASVVAETEDAKGNAVSSCPVAPGVASSALAPEQVAGGGDQGLLLQVQQAVDARIWDGTTAVAGYGDTVRSVFVPTGQHVLLIAYQRSRCTAGAAAECTIERRTSSTASEGVSLYCVTLDTAHLFDIVTTTATNEGKWPDAETTWRPLAAIVAEHGAWCG